MARSQPAIRPGLTAALAAVRQRLIAIGTAPLRVPPLPLPTARTLVQVTDFAVVLSLGLGFGLVGTAGFCAFAGQPPHPGAAGAGILLLVVGMLSLLARASWHAARERARLRAMIDQALQNGERSTRCVRAILAGVDEGVV